MHWFDRFSEGVATATDARTSRRTLVKGAALATVALPFAHDGLAYATNRVNKRIAETECLNCFSYVTKQQSQRLGACAAASAGGTAGAFSLALLKPKGGGAPAAPKAPKAPKKKEMKPAEAPVEISCQARSELMFLGALETCRVKTCSLHPPGPAPAPGGGSVTPGGGGSGCAPGTTQCGATLCCYGGDSCCPCTTVEGGLICCAAVIGCTCCG